MPRDASVTMDFKKNIMIYKSIDINEFAQRTIAYMKKFARALILDQIKMYTMPHSLDASQCKFFLLLLM